MQVQHTMHISEDVNIEFRQEEEFISFVVTNEFIGFEGSINLDGKLTVNYAESQYSDNINNQFLAEISKVFLENKSSILSSIKDEYNAKNRSALENKIHKLKSDLIFAEYELSLLNI